MKIVTTLIAAAFLASGATMATAQSGGAGAAAGAGADVSTPRKNVQRLTPNSPAVNRRGDQMVPMQGSNASNRSFIGKFRDRMQR
jgi:hypothetical protein